MKVSIDQIKQARVLISEVVKQTPLEHSIRASRLLGHDVFFKLENQQITGSFKIRGAMNKIATLSPEEKARGVVASSAGNHAQGVAYSASKFGVPAVIVMPENAPLVKVIATKDYGAEVILKGEIYDEAFRHAKHLEKEKGYVFVNAFEDEKVIAGQGTLGLEIVEQLPDVDTVIVPLGGGGLISGVALAVKDSRPDCRIIGVQSNQTPGMSELYHGQEVSSTPRRISTIADGIAVKNPSPNMHASFISKIVDEIVTVSDDEIAEAIVFLLERSKTVAEGAGAAGLAALLSHKVPFGKKTCVIISGGNIDLNIISKTIEKGQIRRGRLVELSVIVDDLPGSLSRLTNTIAEHRANILEVHHDRVSKGLFLRETRIDFVLETSSAEHIQLIRESLEKMGARIL